MLSRSLWARTAAPLKRQAIAPFAARRSVTTDAASAHAENIPEVGRACYQPFPPPSIYLLSDILACRNAIG
jgi:hypothetical protein